MPNRGNFWWRSALAGVVLLAGAATMCVAQHYGPTPPEATFRPSHAALPFELFRGNRIFLPAELNGHRTDVMLDTGASMTTIDRAYARSIGLPEGQKIRGHGPGGDVEAELISGNTLDLGGVRFTNMTIAVLDLQPVARAIGHPMPIVLGREFFNSAVVSIEWENKSLKLTSHEAFRPAADATQVDLAKRGPFNLISVSVAGAPAIDALFDLGSGSALVLPATYWKTRPELTSLKSAQTTVGGVGGRHAGHATTVPEVTLAGSKFTAVPAILAEGGNDHDPAQMANVGIGFMKQFKVDLDLGRDRVYLARRADAPPFQRDRAGVVLDLEGDRMRVAFVSPEGPAAATGLKQGDEIIAIDGRPPAMAYAGPDEWSKRPAGSNAVLTKADGSKITIKLADYY